MNYLDKQDKRQDISNHSNNMIITGGGNVTSVKESVRRGNAVGFLTMVMSFADMPALIR